MQVSGSLTITSVAQALRTAEVASGLDLSRCTFIDPVGLVTVAATHALWCDDSSGAWRAPDDVEVCRYLERMRLPKVLHEATGLLPDKRAPVREHDNSGYLVELEQRGAAAGEAELGQVVLDRLDRTVADEVRRIVWECVVEAWLNIGDHAQVDSGFAAAQVFERHQPNQRLVIGIADAGIGIASSLRARLGALSDVDAIARAVAGASSMPDPGRGTGLPTMRASAADELGGRLLVLSGRGGLLATPGWARPIELPVDVGGTVIGIELPCGVRASR